MFNDIRGIFAFLTVIPTGDGINWDRPGRMLAWGPLAGLVIGLLTTLTSWLVQDIPPQIGAFVTLLVWVAITGGLHLDGWGDSADALLAAVEPKRRLEIMKDPRTGSWAVVALVMLLLGKFAGVYGTASWVLIIPPVVARWVMALAAWHYPYARKEGLGGMFRAGLGNTQIAIATFIMSAVIGALAAWQTPLVLVAPLLGLGIFFIGGQWASDRLGGGITGDVYGALTEFTELVCVLVLAGLAL